jgi:hypothetical protein
MLGVDIAVLLVRHDHQQEGMPMSLFISVTTPTSAFSECPMDKAITFFAASAIMERRGGNFPPGPELDISFMVTGPKDAPDFQGMRMGGYNEENHTLYFETAIPPHLNQSAAAPQYVQAVLQDAVDNAQDYFNELGVDFDYDHWHQAINALARPGYAQQATQ